MAQGVNVVLGDGFEDGFLLQDSAPFFVPGIAGACSSGARTAPVPESAEAGLEPVSPCGAAVEVFIATFFTAGGAVGASTGVADVDDDPGQE